MLFCMIPNDCDVQGSLGMDCHQHRLSLEDLDRSLFDSKVRVLTCIDHDSVFVFVI